MRLQTEFQHLVSWQLGRVPAIPYSLKVSCRFGRPAVLYSAPYTLTGKPNPNLYYLSCPYLRKEAARLEGGQLMSYLKDRLTADADLAASLKEEQNKHRTEWSRAAKASDSLNTNKSDNVSKIRHAVTAPNIAAAGDDMSIKCLHAHIAWYLVHPKYLLGQIIIEQVRSLWCHDDKCAGHGRP